MAKQKKLSQLSINSRELLRVIHVGQRMGTEREGNAADSLRSLLALNLKHETVILPVEMVPYWKTLTQLEKE